VFLLLFFGPYNNHKLDFRSSPCVLFGYNSSHLGYQCFDITSQRIYISRHVCFHEHMFPCDNSEQIAKVLNTPPTQLATVLLPNLLPSPLLPTHTALPPQTATLPQPPTLLYPSSHACLSNHYDAGSACPSISSSHKNAAPTSVGTISSPPLYFAFFGQGQCYYRFNLCLQPLLCLR